MKVLSVVGTRPEAVKMAPVLRAMAAEPAITSRLCLSGQHGRLAREPLRFFGITPDRCLSLDRTCHLADAVAHMALKIGRVIEGEKPDRVLVHGDTATAAAAAQAAYFRRIPVAHVEAGLRSFRRDMPWPEETIRCLIDDQSDLLFAPTPAARDNLLAERSGGRILVTGNTGIDALQLGMEQLGRRARARAGGARKLILVTGHRRENIGAPLHDVCDALLALARRGDADIVLPVHPNREVAALVHERLASSARIQLVPPLGYGTFLSLLRRADLVLSDSGGVQEEAVALGRPLLSLREATEGGEALLAPGTELTGTDPGRILDGAERALALPRVDVQRVLPNPFGDGRASHRIIQTLLEQPVAEFHHPAELHVAEHGSHPAAA